MSNSREISQLSSFITVDDATKNIGITSGITPFVGIGSTSPTVKLDVVGDANVSGNVTAQNYYGSGANLTGISTFANANIASGIFSNIYVSGISTLGITSATNLTAQQLNVSGIATLTQISAGGTVGAAGSILSSTGSGLSWIPAASGGSGGSALSIFTSTSSTPQFITFVSSASTTSIGITASNLTFIPSSGSLGIGTTNPTSKLHVVGDVRVTGVMTATTFVGALTGIAASATQLVTPRTFEITGDVVASPISFDGTGNVSFAATIQPNSVGLGTDTTGDYVRDITGTVNQISVSATSGEGSTPTLSIPSQFTAPQDVTVTRDLQVNRNLNVTGNITIGGTSATLFTTELKISDPDIVLGFRTDGSGNDVSNDNTANHGGVALASTEGTPLVQLFIAGIETTPATYKKIMWFKSGTFSGLGTDAWLINYAVGIGSTQFPTGTRLAAGNVQFTQNDLAVVRNINASGVITATSGFSGNASSATYATNAGIATYATSSGIATYSTSSGIATYATSSGISTYATSSGIATYATNAGVSTYATNAGIATYATNAGVSTYATSSGISTYATSSGIATNLKGGSGGTIVYQSSTDTTAFLANGTGGYILQANGGTSAPSWVPAAPAGAITGLTIRDEGTIVGSSNSISQLNFVGTIVSATSTAGIATITFLDYVGNAGIATYATIAGYSTSSGIATYATSSGIATYATNAGVSTYATSSGISTYSTSSGISTYATSSGIATYATSSGIATYATNAGTSTSVIGGIASVTQLSVSGISTFNNNVHIPSSSVGIGTTNPLQRLQVGTANTLGINTNGTVFVVTSNADVGIGTTNPTSKLHVIGDGRFTGVVTATSFSGTLSGYASSAGIATYSTSSGIATYATSSGIATYATSSGIATYATSSGIATYATSSGIATYATSSGIATYATNAGTSTSVIGGIASVTQLSVSGITTLGIITAGNIYSTGVITATSFSGNASSASYATSSGIATYATSSGIATYATSSGIATYATIAGYSTSSGIATYATSSGIATYATSSGIATYATSSGIATNLKGGVIGNIPYQSAADTTVFLTNGGSGTVLQSNGVGAAPTWVAAAPTGAVTGLVVRDFNNNIVGTSGSVSQLTFSTGLSVTGTTGAAGIATITLSSNIVGTSLSISGISTFANGPILIGSGTSTGTTSQPLQVTGGAYVSGKIGIGTTNPQGSIHIFRQDTVSGIETHTDFILENPGKGNARFFLKTRDNNRNWEFFADDDDGSFGIYDGVASARRFTILPSGNVLIGSSSTIGTGTTDQRLQVTGGAYVSGNLGVGVTAPAFKADIAGDVRVTSENKMRFGGTAGTTNFYIQYNSTTNSLDFVAG